MFIQVRKDGGLSLTPGCQPRSLSLTNFTMNFLPHTQVLLSLVTPVFLPLFPWHCLVVILYLSQTRRLCGSGEPCRPAGGVPLQQCCFSIGQNSVHSPRPVSNTSCFSRLSVVTRIFSAHKSPLLEGGFANDGGGGNSRSGFPGLPRECCRKNNPWPKGLPFWILAPPFHSPIN